MPVRRIRNTWFIDFHFGGERCRRKSPLNTRQGALAYELFLRKEAALLGSIGAALQANIPALRAPCPTLSEFVPRWISGYVSVNNRPTEQKHKQTFMEWHLLPHFGGLRLCDIGQEAIEQYKGLKRTQGYSAKTINNHLAVLHRCLTCAKDWKVMRTEVPRMPNLKTPLPTFRFLTDTECEKLLAHAPDAVARAMILMGLRTGLRFCELSGLEWQDVDVERRLVVVCRSRVGNHVGPPKNNRIRHVPLTRELVDALAMLPRFGPNVFHEAGKAVNYSMAWRTIDQTSREAGIEHVSWHDLRHTFASQLVQRGASLLAVQKLLGHSDIQVTMRYSHLGRDALQDTVALLEKVAA